jgi:hypothetical protein
VADVLPHFEAIILSPGPGTPAKEADFGWAAQLVRLCPVPILGVCLGMQGIATALGAEVRFAGRIEHGQRVAVASSGGGVFAGADPEAGKWVVYNSLVVSRESTSSPATLADVPLLLTSSSLQRCRASSRLMPGSSRIRRRSWASRTCRSRCGASSSTPRCVLRVTTVARHWSSS